MRKIALEEDFTGGEVVVICPEPDVFTSILFRKRNSVHVFAIDDGRLMLIDGNPFTSESLKTLSGWVKQNSDQLMDMWNSSRENLLKYNS